MCVFVYTYVLPYLQAHENKDHVLLVCIILVSTLILGKKKKKMVNEYLLSATENTYNKINIIRSFHKFCKKIPCFGLDPRD